MTLISEFKKVTLFFNKYSFNWLAICFMIVIICISRENRRGRFSTSAVEFQY